LRTGGAGQRALVLCCSVEFDALTARSLIGAMPQVLLVRRTRTRDQALVSTLEQMTAEVASTSSDRRPCWRRSRDRRSCRGSRVDGACCRRLRLANAGDAGAGRRQGGGQPSDRARVPRRLFQQARNRRIRRSRRRRLHPAQSEPGRRETSTRLLLHRLFSGESGVSFPDRPQRRGR
jgi:hypothetical protein